MALYNNKKNEKKSFAMVSLILLTFVIVARPQDFFPIIGKIRPGLLFSLIALIATIMEGRTYLKKEVNKTLIIYYLLFYFCMILGIPFAQHAGIAFERVIFTYSVNILYFFLFVVNIDTEIKLKSIMFTIVSAIFFFSSLSLIFAKSNFSRFAYGAIYDPNDLAFFLVSLAPLSLLFLYDSARIKKKVSFLTLMISLLVILMTGSRGGLLALAAVLMVIFFSKRILKTNSKILMVFISLLILITQLDKIPLERYTTMTEITSDYNVSSEFGRFALWKYAVKFSLEHPLTGVGVGCFPFAIGYLRAEENIQPRWQTAHSSYFLIAAEMGLLGVIIFLKILAKCFFIFKKGFTLKNEDNEDLEKDKIYFTVFVSFIGLLVASAFISQSYSTIFTIFFGIATVLPSALSSEKSNKNIV